MPQNIFADSFAEQRSGFLVEPEMHTAEDSRDVNIIGDLLEGRVVKHDTGHGGIHERDVMAIGAELLLENRARRAAETRMT